MLIFGGSGRTGTALCHMARRDGWEVLSPAHGQCDLLDAEAVSDCVLGSEAAAVVNCAAISSLERCLENPLEAHLVNAVAPGAMALACRHTGARFVHLSTDYVLDGRREGKKAESSRCRPCSIYGESKREGEWQVAESFRESLIARVSWVCGNPHKPAFVEQMLRRAGGGEALSAIADKFSMPTDVQDIARAILALVQMDFCGTVHLCSGGEPVSWYDCAQLALQTAVEEGFLPELPPVARQLLNQVPFFREERPRHTAMENHLLLSLGIPMPSAAETIRNVARRCLSAC